MKPLKRKLTIYIVIIVLTINSTPQVISNNQEDENGLPPDCFGFLIPLPSGNDTTSETILICIITNLINDLLRENISVYQATKPFTAYTRRIDELSQGQHTTYDRGAFIIPFSGDISKDILICVCIFDYNISNELENQTRLVPVYEIIQPLYIRTYKLTESKIAQHLGLPTRYGWPCFLQIAESGGFFNFEYLLDNETASALKIEDFNIFMWPYKPHPARLSEIIYSLSHNKGINSIRKFVKDGGGYIGTCYGATVASSGFLYPFPFVTVLRSYNTRLPNFPFFYLSLADNAMHLFEDKRHLYITTSTITNTTHPLSFGLNTTINEFFNSAWFQWTGINSHIVGQFINISFINTSRSIPSQLKTSLIGTPNWVTSTFGKGKIVQFACHPEFVINIPILFNNIQWNGDPYYGRRIIFNALFYVSSEKDKDSNLIIARPRSFIEKIQQITYDIPLEYSNHSNFKENIANINLLNQALFELRAISAQLKIIFSTLLNDTALFDEDYLKYRLSYVYQFCNIYSNFTTKTISNLTIIDQVVDKCEDKNISSYEFIFSLSSDLSVRFSHSKKIIFSVLKLAQSLNRTAYDKQLSPLQKILIPLKAREMLKTFEIGLKYIPQMYFETLKLLRHLWYLYQMQLIMITEG